VLVAGCGRIAFDVRGDGSSSGDDDGGGGDARPIDAAPCASWSTWSTPVAINAGSHYMGSISDDGLMLMYANYNGTNNDDLYIVTRTSTASAFGAEQLVTELQTVDNDFNPITHDGLTVYFTSERGATPADLYVTTRPNLGAQFSTPVAVAGGINQGSYDATGWVSPDGLRMYLASDFATPDVDIYVASRASTAVPFGAANPLAELEAAGTDAHPVLTSDELEIIWSSRRLTATYDLFHATRANRTDPFGSPTVISELQTFNDDGYAALSPDGTTMYFNYNFLTTTGTAPVFMSTRTCQ
jgi:hypothetical protein